MSKEAESPRQAAIAIRSPERVLVYLLAFLVARSAPGVSPLIYAGLPVLYFLSITVLRSGR